ncbi:MAG TPA: rod shape-determining protein RodA [Candidatus Magasanikbacteria bacterium]|nr:rod shape-determining protein RodA [Candidatus Magasanikbacteria bacterium]
MFNLAKFSGRSFDWLLFSAVFFLIAFGLMAIYSVDLSRGSELIYFKKQVIALAIGLGILFAGSLTQYTFFRTYARWFYYASLFALLAVLILGHNIRGTTGWFSFGGFSFQPVELAKVGVILMLAYTISNFGRQFEKPKFFFWTLFLTLLPIFLIMIQPDLGSAVLVGTIWFSLMLLTGAKKSLIFGFIMLFVTGAIFSWFFLLQDYQKDRLMTFIDPSHDPLGSGYNVMQATIAVGSGNIFGRGLGFGSQSQLRFLPETQTDFIFSVIAEEMGFLGVGVILILFLIVFWRLLSLASKTSNDFIALTVSGTAALFFTQFFINIGANIGILPVTGVTLPFVSYGGSSLIMNLLLIGIVQSMVEKKY